MVAHDQVESDELLGATYCYTSIILGCGSYGKVFKGFVSKTKEVVAVKVMEESKTPRTILYETTALNKMRGSRHENVTQMFEYYEGVQGCTFIVMEFCDGGDILGLINVTPEPPVKLIQSLSFQMSQALVYLDSLGIIHGDIKPENIFISKNNKTDAESWYFTFKLGDFGMSVIFEKEKKAKGRRGSEEYMAPEVILSCPYDGKIDLWSFGATVHALISRNMLYDGTIFSIKSALPWSHPRITHEDLRSLINGLLTIDQDERISLPEFVCHSFHSAAISDDMLIPF